ncbi:MAG TPA: glycosyltransferase, partial [Anaerolineae bacterium]|nr:glycosyltransferase [Anaerolineae bacterium]
AVGGIPEIIDHGVTGLLVPPHCPDALAQTILNLLQNPQLQKKLGQAGQEKAKTVFSLNNHLQSIQSIYTQVVEQNGYR